MSNQELYPNKKIELNLIQGKGHSLHSISHIITNSGSSLEEHRSDIFTICSLLPIDKIQRTENAKWF